MVSSVHLFKDDGDKLSDPTEYCSLASALHRLSLVGYADASWGLDFDDRRSTSGYSEYKSLVAATSDVIWLISLLQKLRFSSSDKPTVWCDNSSVVAVAANPVLHSKFKHVKLD
ncbi:hypothetical protein PVK06_033734 [Gossypium arboreum]|uniref:Uncharacterized protein n=1 Tax=Gossypium arboreum TaxID=29729 RepID=A0ABR0NEF2_GOSAR|nr:hypothetical protein PVK06_033734 [Gossypium arboreum]